MKNFLTLPAGWERGIALCVRNHVQGEYFFRRGDYFAAKQQKFTDVEIPIAVVQTTAICGPYGDPIQGPENWVFLGSTRPSEFRRAGFNSGETEDRSNNARPKEERSE